MNSLAISFPLFYAITNNIAAGKGYPCPDTLYHCQIPISSSVSEYQPLLMDPYHLHEFFYPEITSPASINLWRRQSVRIMCPFGNLRIASRDIDQNVAVLSCHENDTFLLDGSPINIYPFESFKCSVKPTTTMYEMSNCANDFCLMTGVLLSPFDYIRSMTIEFEKNYSQVFAYAVLHSSIIDSRQINENPGKYVKGLHFMKFSTDLEELYNLYHQRYQFSRLLSDAKLASRYIPEDGSNYLTEAQLISRNDLFYLSQQTGTYFYENVIPMWKSVRDGNWKLVDKVSRRYAREISLRSIIVLSGTIDTLTLEDANKRLISVILRSNVSSESLRLNVPKIVYKWIYDPFTRKGIAFLTVNNPFVGQTSSSLDLFLCKPLDHCVTTYPEFQIPERGITYCCAVNDFRSCCFKNKYVGIESFYYQ